MLILAGVSLNAIIGDNGLITQTQYASFLQEMTAVQEAVDTWKAGRTIDNAGELTNKIPVTRMVTQAELTNSSRLTGEVGYYRVWSLTGKRPTQSVSLSVSEFDSEFSGEIISYPAGIQDLYVLNNEILDLDEDKVYYIDAVNSMIYSANGFAISGVSAHSLNMLNAIMNGSEKKPKFASAEVSGGGSNGSQILAGNTAPEYLMNENGEYVDEDGEVVTEENKVKNPNYNPNGFQIIADFTNENLYKLYNNGDLYGKGIKGIGLNSSIEEMNKIDTKKWNEFTIPSNIPGYNTSNIEIIPGDSTFFVIDTNKNLWAWGDNSNNKLGLTKEQQIEYTGMEVVKLDLEGKPVYNVFSTSTATFVVTCKGGIYELYASGFNDKGQIGIGNELINQEKFYKCEFNNPENIVSITNDFGNTGYSIILCSDGKMYFAGDTGKGNANYIFYNTENRGKILTNFIEIFNNVYGDSFSNKIIDIQLHYQWGNPKILLLDNQGKLYEWWGSNLVQIDENVQKICGASGSGLYIKKDNENQIELYGNTSSVDGSGIFGSINPRGSWQKLNDYLDFDINLLENVYQNSSSIFYLLSNGKVYYSGRYSLAGCGISSGVTDRTICLQDISNLPLVSSIKGMISTGGSTSMPILFGKNDGKMYATGNNILIFRENILQKNWILVASNVKKFKACSENGALAYIDRNNDLYVAGEDSTMLGLNSTNVSVIRNFVRQKDYLKALTGTEDEDGVSIYNHLDGKVEDYWICDNVLFIKTNSSDSNTIYACGTATLTTTWRGNNFTGLGKTEDAFIPTKLEKNIRFFHAYGNARMYITFDNELYTWGSGGWNFPMASFDTYTPQLTIWNNIDLENVYKADFRHGRTYLWVKDGDNNLVYNQGLNNSSYCCGLPSSSDNFVLYDLGDEIIEATTIRNSNTDIILTKNNGIYGFGVKCLLGIGNFTTEIQKTAQKLEGINEEIIQVAGGNDYAIVVTKTGKVYGTGSNKYGILGRWIGIDRNSPNSRYKTAFEWVECPELEI